MVHILMVYCGEMGMFRNPDFKILEIEYYNLRYSLKTRLFQAVHYGCVVRNLTLKQNQSENV